MLTKYICNQKAKKIKVFVKSQSVFMPSNRFLVRVIQL